MNLIFRISMWFLINSLLAIIGVIAYYLQRWYRKPYINDFLSKTVFITGTDSGFGFNLAVNLARHGIKVYAGCYTEEGKEALKKATKNGVKTILIDITNKESVIRAKQIVEEDLKETGKELFGLVNNAGTFSGCIFALSNPEDYRNTMEVNFFGTLSVTETFLPLIKKSVGRIVMVTSISGRQSSGIETYSCSKHALEVYSNGLRRWMRNYKIHVAIIEPGMFKSTNLFSSSTVRDNIDKHIKNWPENLKEEYGEKILQKKKREMVLFMSNPPFAKWNRISMVTNALKHALFAQHPKDRYVCGWDALMFFKYLTLIPDFMFDLMLEKGFFVLKFGAKHDIF